MRADELHSGALAVGKQRESESMSAHFAVADTQALTLKIRGRRITAADYLQWQQASEALETANTVLAEARAEAVRIRETAQRDGHQAGVELAFKELMVPILDAKREARKVLDASAPQLVDLAERMIRRILPRLDQDAVVRELLQSALAELNDEQQILVRVHPEHLEQTTDIVSEWQRQSGYSRAASTESDKALPAYHCIIKSELGEVHLGFEQQLSRLSQAALSAANQTRVDDVTSL
ncbi:MAG: hypothetical protein CME36_11700 [unclassified Hahellaceae]|nr:hypothetical protein [Hahellaceae bacterium]